MGWLGISLTIVLISVLYVHWNSRRHNWRRPIKDWINIDDYILVGILSLIVSLFLVALFGGIYSIAKEGRDTTAEGCIEISNRWEIASAVREKNTTGSFILGTGGMSTVDTYYAYQIEPKGLMLTEYPTRNTYIVEQDGTPRYDRIDTICPKPVYDFLWWSTGNTHRNYGEFGTLSVPKNTILREFRL